PAAGDDDGDLLFPDADDLPVRLHLSDREHADGHSAVHLPDSAALLLDNREGDIPEGDRAEAVVAPGGGSCRLGIDRAGAGCRSQPEARRVTVATSSARSSAC